VTSNEQILLSLLLLSIGSILGFFTGRRGRVTREYCNKNHESEGILLDVLKASLSESKQEILLAIQTLKQEIKSRDDDLRILGNKLAALSNRVATIKGRINGQTKEG
jgi:hypothetical protein